MEKYAVSDLAIGQLPSRLLKSINNLEITIEELVDFYKNQPRSKISIENGKLNIRLNLEIKIGKLLAFLAGLFSALWFIVTNLDKIHDVIK